MMLHLANIAYMPTRMFHPPFTSSYSIKVMTLRYFGQIKSHLVASDSIRLAIINRILAQSNLRAGKRMAPRGMIEQEDVLYSLGRSLGEL